MVPLELQQRFDGQELKSLGRGKGRKLGRGGGGGSPLSGQFGPKPVAGV